MLQIYKDYIIPLTPILLSVIAIIISIKTSKRQNKISLFDKRYEVFKRCLHFYDVAHNYWCLGSRSSIGIVELKELEYSFDLDVEKTKFLFDKETSEILGNAKPLFEDCIKYYSNLKSKEDRSEEIEKLHKEKIDYNKKQYIKSAEKYLKVK